MLFAWLFAMGHLWVEHGCDSWGGYGAGMVNPQQGHGHADGHHHHHHDVEDRGEDPDSPLEHHHHDVGIAVREAGGIMVGAPLVAVLIVTLFFPEVPHGELRTEPAITGSPPDERRSGYLFVIQTAQPVRGPSVVA